MLKHFWGKQMIRHESNSSEKTDENLEIILASSSPRRKKLLEELGLDFRCQEPEILEEETTEQEVPLLVQKLALLKAKEVAKRLQVQALIITADTLIEFEGRTLGKPQNKNEAVSMLIALSAKTHSVYTGFCILNTATEKVWQGYDKTSVTFKNLTPEEIRQYVEAENVETMAGAYNLAPGTPGEKLIAHLDGSLTNVIGLPLEKILPILAENQVKVKKPVSSSLLYITEGSKA